MHSLLVILQPNTEECLQQVPMEKGTTCAQEWFPWSSATQTLTHALFYPSPCAQALCDVLPWVAMAPHHIHPLSTGKCSGCTEVAQLHGLLPQVVNVLFHKHPCRLADPFMYYTGRSHIRQPLQKIKQ